MSYRSFALLCALASAGYGGVLHYFGEGTIWQVVLMGVVGFLAPWILALVIWMLILPSDACSVAKELCDQIGRRFSKFKK